jgi:hypothetical protein
MDEVLDTAIATAESLRLAHIDDPINPYPLAFTRGMLLFIGILSLNDLHGIAILDAHGMIELGTDLMVQHARDSTT